MHKFVLIPYAAVLVSAVFGSVSIAWNSDRRATGAMGALFLCTGAWALLELMIFLSPDAEMAQALFRFIHLPPLMLGASGLWAVAQVLPQARVELSRQARRAAGVALVLGVLAAMLPGTIESVVPSPFGGWSPRYGGVSWVAMSLGLAFPIYAAIAASARARVRDDHIRSDQNRSWALRICVGLSIAIVLPTDFVLPLLGIPIPRVGALVVSLCSAVTWLLVLYESDDLVLAPQMIARSLLADLQDGVALVQLDGRLLSTNPKFCELVGAEESEQLSASLDALVDIPLASICAGLDECEAVVTAPGGSLLPVSVSSSIVFSSSGVAQGVVVVFRDLRPIEALRRRLVSSGRLAAIGELAAGIAHEVNNPVAFIRSDLNLLRERIQEIESAVREQRVDGGVETALSRIRLRVHLVGDYIERIAEIVRDVREFAHAGGAGQGGSDPEQAVEGAMRLARLQRGDDVSIRVATVAVDSRIDAGQELKQILLAVLRILVEDLEKGGSVEVDLRTDAQNLSVRLRARSFMGDSDSIAERLGAMSTAHVDPSARTLDLVAASELLDQLGGQISLESGEHGAVQIELTFPLDPEHDRMRDNVCSEPDVVVRQDAARCGAT